MEKRTLEGHDITGFGEYLACEEKSRSTIQKYLHDVRVFCDFVKDRELSKELVREWKESLLEGGYAASSVNSMLAGVNGFLSFLGRDDCRVKNLRIQKRTYCPEEEELTKAEYLRLLGAAEENPQMRLVMETICGTGIRVSELRHFTVEAVRCGRIEISCKGKIRTILIPGRLKKRILDHARKNGIRRGVVFLGRTGKPLDRSRIWAWMKKICEAAGVSAGKVFPHNLRKLFARTFYRSQKDIARLADALGHSSINTTRIYITATVTEQLLQMESLGLVT